MRERSRGTGQEEQGKACRNKQHVKIDNMKEMSNLICGRFAVGGNYNSTRDSIWFFDKAAETRVYYNQMGAEICRKSECRQDLLRLLNFINARVFLELNDGGNRWYDPQILYTPRMYLTEDNGYDLSITTMLNYRFWRTAELETNDYITAYQPELLDKLAPFVFGVLKGELTAEDAILCIEHNVLNEV